MTRKYTGRKALTVVAATAVAGSALFVGGVAQAATAKDIPTVTKIGPNATAVAGGTWVSISGKNFVDSALPIVKVGGTTVDSDGDTDGDVLTGTNTDVIVVSDSRLLAKVPAKAAGIYRLSVQNSKGVSLDSPGDSFGYIAAPAIVGLTKADGTAWATGTAAGTAVGGDTLVVKGTNLQHATKVTIDGIAAPISKRTKSATHDFLTVKTPAHVPTASAVNVLVTTPAGTSPEPGTATDNDFSYAAHVKSTSAKNGPAAGGNAVVLTGTGFKSLDASAPVKLGTVTITQFVVVSDTELVAVLPSGSANAEAAWSTSTDGTNYTASTLKYKYVA